MKKVQLLQIILSCLLLSCSNINRDKPVAQSDLKDSDYRIFQNTPAWELAKAVQDNDEKKIEEIVAKDPKLINYQERKYGNTLLMLTIMNQQLKPFKTLLANNANVNIHNTYDGASPLIEACSFEEYDRQFAETLLQYGANANDVETGERRQGNSTRLTPLMAAAETGNLDLVVLLVKKGADVNFHNEYKQSALSSAVMQNEYSVALYLLQNGADYKLPLFYRPGSSADYDPSQDKPMYLVDILREDVFELGSEKYNYKMQVVNFLKNKGIDYKAAPIPEYIKKKVREKYPKTWQEYLEKY
jgi:hypothetical protein